MFEDYAIIHCNINKKKYTLYVADNHKKRIKGLSGIKKLDKDKGMIFIMDENCNNPFTMKNTHLHLNLLFLDENFKIIDSFSCKPFQKKLIKPDVNYSYVIEIQ